MNPGARLGQYELVAPLAVGGMGEVWLARAPQLGRARARVVVKILLPHLAADPSFVEQLRYEAALTCRVRHPNVVQIYDCISEGRIHFVVMEYLEGYTLRKLADRTRERRELMPAWLAVRVVSRVCRGLHFAHELRDAQGGELGLVHGDLTLENIMVTSAGVTKLLDFGAARTARCIARQAGLPHGIPRYLAPEQLVGCAADRRSDVYALGAVLYECLTGAPAFRGPTRAAVMRAVAAGGPPRPRALNDQISEQLSDIVWRAINPDPAQRFATARQLADSLVAELGDDRRSRREIGRFVRQLSTAEWAAV